MEIIPRTIAYIDLNVLDGNYRIIKSMIPSHVKLLCVVKSDAYGHGANMVAQRLESNEVDYLGVATIDEGIELRDSGIHAPILVMSGILPWDNVEALMDNNLTPVVYDMETLNKVKERARSFVKAVRIHIKVDTGMGRLGFSPDDINPVINFIKGEKFLYIEGIMSHFSLSEKRDEYGMNQIKTFNKVLRIFEENGIKPDLVHMANSGAITNYPEAYFDMVRVGISLYGSHPARGLSEKLPVQQVMKLASRIAHIREFQVGCSLSYGRTYTTKRKTRVAYIPLGYADGYPRVLSNRGSVLIKGERCSIVGRICMDWLLVDITDVDCVQVGEEVVLLGSSGNAFIHVDEIAEYAETIPYEILCNISPRILRVYV